MRYFDAFTGVGGFTLGIKQAYESIQKLRTEDEKQRVQRTRDTQGRQTECDNISSDGLTCVGYSEIDKYASSIYQRHFPNHKNYGDITKINENELPDFELFVGGFPCQAFSIAGKRRGFDDTRGTLFFDIARILKEKRPRLLLLENVKGLLSHDGGRTFKVILTTLTQLGYDLQWQVCNSKNHGVPQNRERVLIVGHLRGTPRPEVFPFGVTDEQDTQVGSNASRGAKGIATRHLGRNGSLISDHASTLQVAEVPHIVQLNQPKHSNDRVYGAEGISPTLNTMQGGNRQPFVATNNLNDMVSYSNGKESKLDDGTLESKEELRKKIRDLFKMSGESENGYTPQELELARQSYRKLGGDVSELPLSGTQSDKEMQCREMYTEEETTRILREAQPEIREIWESADVQEKSIQPDYRIRRLSPVECERLQGFPDGWTEGVSDTQRYKCLGNAVTVNVIADVMERIYETAYKPAE